MQPSVKHRPKQQTLFDGWAFGENEGSGAMKSGRCETWCGKNDQKLLSGCPRAVSELRTTDEAEGASGPAGGEAHSAGHARRACRAHKGSGAG